LPISKRTNIVRKNMRGFSSRGTATRRLFLLLVAGNRLCCYFLLLLPACLLLQFPATAL
jgi:hypothetical protein